MKKLTFKEKEALKVSAIDGDLYKKLKEILEEEVDENQVLQGLVWDPKYETFLVEKL